MSYIDGYILLGNEVSRPSLHPMYTCIHRSSSYCRHRASCLYIVILHCVYIMVLGADGQHYVKLYSRADKPSDLHLIRPSNFLKVSVLGQLILIEFESFACMHAIRRKSVNRHRAL